ncbi:hypothetical protein ACA910_019321 [Epithemia clementina (nom. ined.)]
MPPEVDEANRLVGFEFPDETTGLVPTSPLPTNPSSQKDLATLETNVLGGASFLKDDDISYSSKTKRQQLRKKSIKQAFLLSFFAATLVIVCSFWKHGRFARKRTAEDANRYLDCKSPLSMLDPVDDLGLADFHRPNTSMPSSVLHQYIERHNSRRPIPTNAWYQNLLLIRSGQEPSSSNRAYTIPYIVDAAGPIPGLRMHTNHMYSSTNVLQLNVNEMHGITMGAVHSKLGQSDVKTKNIFSVQEMTQLAVTLSWDDFGMSTPIVKGMAYATMAYNNIAITTPDGEVFSPAIATEVPVGGQVLVDQQSVLSCLSSNNDDDGSSESSVMWVEKEISVYTPESDFTWLVFVSEPVKVKCEVHGGSTILRVLSGRRKLQQMQPFYFRTALFEPCTKGHNPVYCHQEQMHPTALHIGQGDYGKILREHAHLFPGSRASVSYSFDEDEMEADLHFDWDVHATGAPLYVAPKNETTKKEVIVYGLPHHLDMMDEIRSPANYLYCAQSLVGPSCLVEGSVWELRETMPRIRFRAERPPAKWSLASISSNLVKDIDYRVPSFFLKGVGDTYFSGKMLARLGRILLITEELYELCNTGSSNTHKANVASDPYYTACQNITMPSNQQMTDAIKALRSSVEIWINGTGATPFVYDSSWGGVASCGCYFNDKTHECDNQYPDCPGFENPGLNFGNAFYNDMHFHYGYHIFGAAVVAHFDPDWGKEHFEQVLLLVRSIANPSEEDEYFPVMRHKDVYQGHSWASGIAVAPLNGRNQESSSESVAAYESVALYGTVMASIFEKSDESKEEYQRAVEVRRVGKLMTASELRATKMYYHVNRDEEIKIYPSEYTPHVVGIMWQTMAQFQTWFGNAPYLPIGIQLLPLTPIAGQRDSVSWAKAMYPSLEKSCNPDKVCEEQGWSVLQLGALATVGHGRLALSRARLLPAKVFESAGGNGHSMSNTLWFIATRAPLEEPLPLDDASTVPQNAHANKTFPVESVVTDCYMPETCTEYVLDTIVDLYTCRQRIKWLIQNKGKSQKDACVQVAAVEAPRQCGQCNPLANYTETVKHAEEEARKLCPPCTEQQCHSDLNRCPLYERTYVCTSGPNAGGCAASPWLPEAGICSECCDLTDCPAVSPLDVSSPADENEANCPVCSEEDCESSNGNLCPIHVAPYLCIDGTSKGGCSPRPWSMHDGQCQQCCKVPSSCSH